MSDSRASIAPTYELHITQTGGETKVHALTSAQLIIGSDPAADICLVGETKLLPQHILIAPRGDQCWISTASEAPLWNEEGQPVEGSFVPWGARLTLGACSFHLQEIEISRESESASNPPALPADTPNESTTTTSPVIVMLLVSVLALAGIALLDGPETSAAALPPAPPELFDAEPACTSKNALHRATLAEEEAFAKSERAVFEKQDGVSAVKLFAEAEACYRVAKRTARSNEVRAQSRSLRASLEEEYKLRRMRLSRALNANDNTQAKAELRQLIELLEHRSDSDYVLALRRLDLHLSKEELP